MNTIEKAKAFGYLAHFYTATAVEMTVLPTVKKTRNKVDEVICEIKNRRNFDRIHNYDRKTGTFN